MAIKNIRQKRYLTLAGGFVAPHLVSLNYWLLTGSEYPYKLDTMICCAIAGVAAYGFMFMVEDLQE